MDWKNILKFMGWMRRITTLDNPPPDDNTRIQTIREAIGLEEWRILLTHFLLQEAEEVGWIP